MVEESTDMPGIQRIARLDIGLLLGGWLLLATGVLLIHSTGYSTCTRNCSCSTLHYAAPTCYRLKNYH